FARVQTGGRRPRTKYITSEIASSTRQTKHRICAIPADADAIPPKPNRAAIRAITRKITAQYSMEASIRDVGGITADACTNAGGHVEFPGAGPGKWGFVSRRRRRADHVLTLRGPAISQMMKPTSGSSRIRTVHTTL